MVLQAGIYAAALDQLGMGALFHDAARFHHHHPVGMFDGGQAVRHHQGGTALHEALQGFLHEAFRFVVERGGGFVEDQDGGILVHGACNGQPLALAAGELGRVVSHHAVHAHGQAFDEGAEIGGLQRRLHAGTIQFAAQGHVGSNGVVEHHHVLAHHGDLGAQAVEGPVVQSHVVEQHAPARRQHKARQQVDQRGLARSRWPHKGHDLARGDVQVDEFECGGRCFGEALGMGHARARGHGGEQGRSRHAGLAVRRLRGIVHMDALEPDVAARTRGQLAGLCGGGCLRLGRDGLDHGEATLQGGHAARDGVGHVRQTPDGRHQHHHGGHEGDKATHRDGTLMALADLGLPQGNGEHRRQRHRGHRLRQRGHGRGGDHRFERELAQAAAQNLEAAALLLLGAMQAHHAVGQHVFLDHVGQLVGGALALLGEAVEAARELAHHPRHAGRKHHHDHGELPVQIQQVAHQRHQGAAVAREPHERLHEHVGAVLHLEHHGVGQRAGRLPREQAEVGIEQAGEHVLAQPHHAVVGNACQRILGRETGHPAQEEQQQHGRRHGPELQRATGEAAVEQGLDQSRHPGFGERCHHRGHKGVHPPLAVDTKIARDAAQTGRQAL